ncbi:MAG: DUF3311 domain-containing protein [Zestosphaera sp.]
MSSHTSRERLTFLVALIPPVLMIFGAPLVMPMVEPFVLGLPFNLFWHVLWLIVGPVVLTLAYLIRTKGE